MVEEGKRRGIWKISDIIVASHDSLFPTERVKLTRPMDISIKSTCMQLSAP
jgi:hypothetical protein